jgi:GNAT superfamily N-acetyltransferase
MIERGLRSNPGWALTRYLYEEHRISYGNRCRFVGDAGVLADCHLSADGIELLTGNCLVARHDSKIVGTVALEPCGQSALLRSLAVAPDCRGHSIGRSLVARMVSQARLLGISGGFAC